MNNDRPTVLLTILFTDIESSTQLWEQDPELMSRLLADHDLLARTMIERHNGTLVKMTGDGICAAFDEPIEALVATVSIQAGLAGRGSTMVAPLRVRCGLHTGLVERRDNDLFGSPVNRAARIMDAAHGEQMLLSQAVVELVRGRLPTGFTLRDLGSVRLRGVATPERVYQLLHPQLRQDFPALRSLEATPHNLPQPVTSFVGWGRAVADVKESLGKARLLTLLGVGGIGKTRLALEAAAEVLNDYPDGVWLVELAPLADARLVAQATASVLGVKEESSRPVIEALVKYVKDRQLLLVLDNCEHLVQACADLAKKLLQSSPRLKILASSRQPLHVTGEMSYQVPALLAPDRRKELTISLLAQYEAVRLFVDRAVMVQPSFRVTEHNAAAVSNVCTRLDGIPLALELAAARVRTLSVEKIDEHLSDRFPLLTGGDKTVLPRQQTLRALIDWSYDLLTEHERIVLNRLAVFAGGWTLESAQAVVARDPIHRSAVLDILSQLVEKSLVSLDYEGERYALLETIKHYAQDRLTELGEDEEIRTRHLHCYLALADNENLGSTETAWLSQLDRELDNLLSALAWCERASNGGDLGLKLVHQLRGYWTNRGLMELGHQIMMDALADHGTQTSSINHSRALSAAGYHSYFMGRYAEAQAYLEDSVSIAKKLADNHQAATSLFQLAVVLISRGKLDPARACGEEAISLARELGDLLILAKSNSLLGLLCRAEKDLVNAEGFFRKALTFARQQGAKVTIAGILANLAATAIELGAGDRARELLLEELGIVEEVDSKWRGCGVIDLCSALASHLQQFKRAARLHGAADAQLERFGLAREPDDDAFIAPLVTLAREQLGADAFTTEEAAGSMLSYETAMAEARAWLEKAY